MRIAPKVIVTVEQRAQLERWAKGRQVPVRLAQRAQIVLLATQGKMDIEIAKQLRVGRRNPARWRKRFVELGLSGIEHDAPRPGRKRTILEHRWQGSCT
jgi:Winged helix-turn helix